MIRDRYTTKVQAAFVLYDAFTGEQAKRGMFRFRLPESGKITAKEGGYYILTGCREQKIQIIIESPFYETETLWQDTEKSSLEIEKVWLTPGKAYPFGDGVFLAEGKGDPGTAVMAVPMDAEQAVRLLKDYDPKTDGNQLSVFYADDKDMEGRLAAVVLKKGKKQEAEPVRIKSMDEKNGICQVENPLSKPVKKTEAAIYPAYTGKVDGQGNYSVPVPKQKEGTVYLVCFQKEGKQMTEEQRA